MVVAGVTVEHRESEGRIRGAQVRVIDFDNPNRNDWLAVNQFTVTENRNTPQAGRRAVRQRAAPWASSS